MGSKIGKIKALTVLLDVFGFLLIFTGSALIRYAKDEVFAILGGFVMAGGVTLLSLTRLIK